MRGRYVALSLLALAAGVAGGIAVERLHFSAADASADDGPKILYWVAPMDPNFRRDGPGKSPMGMDLVPVYEGEEPSGDPSEIQLSATEINAIGVRTAVARVEPVAQRIDTVGFVQYDGHLISHVHMRVEGWIEELEVRAIGDRVAKGDLLYRIFAPKITIASAELMRAMPRNDSKEIAGARRKLLNYGVTDRQIDEMAAAGKAAQYLRVYAPQDGVVTALDAADGMYLQPDTRAMTLADLSSVWLLVDVFERDIGRLSAEKKAIARFEHLPGRVFEGEIDYIYPELDAETRTLPVRLRFDNGEGLLKPNMFGTVTLLPDSSREAVTVPSEAVIRTGRAERVILRTGEGAFTPRLVTTGLRDNFSEGGRTEIVQGLEPGEEVVASAHFLIDSESALTAGLLRMAPIESAPALGTGLLNALEAAQRTVAIRHGPIEALGWPAMETRFTVRADVPLGQLSAGDEIEFAAVRGADGLLALVDLRADDGVDATGSGLVHAVTPDGKLTLSHDPIPELGWPAMRMDMPVAGFDPAEVPLETPVTFDLAKGDDGLFTIVALRTDSAAHEQSSANAHQSRASTMTVEGAVNSVDVEMRQANVTHGPLVEIGMPGMTMDFPLAPEVDPARLPIGPAQLSIGRGDGGALILAGARPKPEPMRVMGQVNSVDVAAGTANVTHGPLTEIGMPGMTMDFAIAPSVDASALPLGRDVQLLLEKGADLSLTLVGIEARTAP